MSGSKEPRYEIDIYWSDEDEAYIAVVPDLLYCSAWGDTHEEALAQVKIAIRGNLKVAEKYGDPIPEPKVRQIS
ncbi:type II toxin-antitoxin system HicB family antitoxin [soil metagenome]